MMDILKRALYPIDGNGKITIEDIVNESSGVGEVGDPVTVDTLTGATTTGKALMKAASQEAARQAIGAGTSNLTIGTSASTAKAGNYTPAVAEVTGLQAALDAKATTAALADLVSRVTALEAAAEG